MNIDKADYGTIIRFGNMQDLISKIKQEEKNIGEVINVTDKENISILEKCLISRKFDIAKYLLANNAKVNNVSKDGCNEFHYISSNINCDEALEIARILLDKGTSLNIKEKKYGNSAIFLLCHEVFKVRSSDGLKFIEECLKKINNYDDYNKNGYSIRTLINERGTDRLKLLMEKSV